MGLSIHNRTLIRGFLAGVVVLAGASACSRDKETETATGRDTIISTDTTNTQTTKAPTTSAPDQSASAAGADTSAAVGTAAPRSETGAARQMNPDTGTAGYRAMERDTGATPSDTALAPVDTTLPGDQSSIAPSDSAPLEVSTPTTTDTSATVDVAVGQDTVSPDAMTDTSAATGVATGQDTISADVAATDTSISADVAAGQDTVSTEVATDTSANQAVIADTTAEMADAAVATDTTAAAADTSATGYTDMARDTSIAKTAADSAVIQAQVDTSHADSTVAISGGISTEADVAVGGEADSAAVGDSVAVSAQVDTPADVPTEVAVQNTPDSVTVVGDSSSVDNPGPRAKEDTISARADSLGEHYDADRIRPPEDSTELAGNVTTDQDVDSATVREEDRETVAQGEAPTDEVGAARVGGEVTGADVLAGTTFQGAQCVVADAESDDTIVLDMSNTPATLNPCGLGSMVPSRLWTKKE